MDSRLSLSSEIDAGLFGILRLVWAEFQGMRQAGPALDRRSKDWHCLAELAKVYDKTGRTADAIALARQALDLAVSKNQQVAHSLQQALDHYEHDGSGANSN